jgi:hypothetical protein
MEQHSTLRFVPQFNAKASQVEKELELAGQKSHAARWSHAKRKQQKAKGQQSSTVQSQGELQPLPKRLLKGALTLYAYPDHPRRKSIDEVQHDKDPQQSRSPSYPALKSLRPKTRPSQEDPYALVDILRGDSDPFNAQGIKITPQINQLVTFIRDAYLPGVYITAYMKFKDSKPTNLHLTTIGEGFHIFGQRTVAKVWSSMKDELSSEGRALAWCSSYLPVLARFCNPEMSRELNMLAIRMRSQSMKILKAQIENLHLDRPPDISLIAQIVSLFRAACKEGDAAAAGIHANIIQRLVNKVEVPDRHIQTLFMTCMNNDSELAIARMSNTFFDYEGWIHIQIQRFWENSFTSNLPQLPSHFDALHKSIQLPATRDAAIRLRQYLLYRSTRVNLDDPDDIERTDTVFTKFTTYSQYDSGVLINAYINLVAGKKYKMGESVRIIEAGLALTTLHVLRRGIVEATVNGGDHRSGHHIITINHLEGTMRRVMATVDADDRQKYDEALLWIFFYGARFEWRVNQKVKGATAPSTWFSRHFAQQARILGLTTCAQVEDLLAQFVFYGFLEPYLSTWFNEVMQASETAHERRYGAIGSEKTSSSQGQVD